ncbi:UDP-glucose dehydrogenase family protein [Thermodesulfobacteriota bacterium]
MYISIFGMGYVGCVSTGCLAQTGNNIIGVDISKSKVNSINRGKSPIVEKGLNALIKKQHDAGKISATINASSAVLDTDVSFICVGTPSTPEGHLNLTAIFKVAEEIGSALRKKKKYHIIIIRSTVLPGTNKKVTELIQKQSGKKADIEFTVVSNPEFLREGSAINDFFNPPYTLIGSKNQKAIEKMEILYKEIDAPLITCDVKIAEIMKYVNNAFHAQKVVFANEVGNICKKLNIDSHKVMDIFCMDRKLNISPYYLKPGFAYGGSCLPKDLKALKTIAHDHYVSCHLIESIERSNEYQKELVYNKILELNTSKIGFLGLSFKADTDDLRNSPILDIIEKLLGKGFQVKIYDKNVHFAKLMGANKEYILNKIPFISKFVTDNYVEVLESSDAIVVVNNSIEFKDILAKVPNNKIIYDLVNIDFINRNEQNKYIGVSW